MLLGFLISFSLLCSSPRLRPPFQLPPYNDISSNSSKPATFSDVADGQVPDAHMDWNHRDIPETSLALHTEVELPDNVETSGNIPESLKTALQVEIPTDDAYDHKSLGSDPMSVSLEQSFPTSDSSSDLDRSKGLKRKDSFYESDEELKIPKKVSPRKSGNNIEKPPGYDAVIASIPNSSSTEQREDAAPMVKPPRQPRPSLNKNVPPADQQLQVTEMITTQSSAPPTHTIFGASVTSSSAALVPSYEQALKSELDAATPDLVVTITKKAAPIAKPDSTESDSEQVFGRPFSLVASQLT